MKFYANRKRTEKSIFLKLRSYRQLSAKLIKDHKLSKKKKKVGPFYILEKIGIVAYKLNLPHSSQIHQVFHITLLNHIKQTF